MAASGDELTFESISAIEREERRLHRMSKIGKTFYEQVVRYLKDLERDIDSAKNSGEHYSKLSILHTEYKNISNIFRSIYENRTRKIVNLALTKVSGGRVDTKNFMDCEIQFFEKLVTLLKEHQDAIFQYPPKKLAKIEVKSQPQAPKPVVKNDEISKPPSLQGYAIIEVLADLPTFAGLDRNYSLKKGDVLNIPVKIAEILCKRGKARVIKT
jgi:DNA replication initiation complex subunit (GINS family)